jgi:hypothetical protein
MAVGAVHGQMCDIVRIMPSLETAPLIDRLDAVRPKQLSWNKWATLAGVNRSVFSDAKKRNNLTVDTLDKLLNAVGVSLAQFEAGMSLDSFKEGADTSPIFTRTIEDALASPVSPFVGEKSRPKVAVYGTALGHDHEIDGTGALRYVELTEIDMGETVNFLARPSGVGERKDIYALYVAGFSMQPRYDPGDPLFIDPHQHPAIGDDVIVQLRDESNDRVKCALIKTLVKRSATFIDLQQYNPAKVFRVPMERVMRIHRVFPRNELHG